MDSLSGSVLADVAVRGAATGTLPVDLMLLAESEEGQSESPCPCIQSPLKASVGASGSSITPLGKESKGSQDAN